MSNRVITIFLLLCACSCGHPDNSNYTGSEVAEHCDFDSAFVLSMAYEKDDQFWGRAFEIKNGIVQITVDEIREAFDTYMKAAVDSVIVWDENICGWVGAENSNQ